MKIGTLYGIGVGPGDPELITIKGVRLIRQCPHVFVPKARTTADSVALSIGRRYLSSSSRVHELIFPMTSDPTDLSRHWMASAGEIAAILKSGEDACFLTLGDPLLYSTYIYLLRELRALWPEARVVTVPGVTAFSAAAALAGFPVGEKKETVTIVPTADDLEDVRRVLSGGGTVILMKVGRRLREVLNLLEEAKLIDRSVFVSHAGMENEQVETDLRRLRAEDPQAGYLSIILVHAEEKRS